MASGKASQDNSSRVSPIVQAIQRAEAGTTGEIRVHLSRSWFEKDPFLHASALFQRFGMTRTTHRNAVLLYVNLRKHKFAVVGDEGIHQVVGQEYWEKLARNLSANLRATHPENAIAETVREIGDVLHRYFPANPEESNPNQLPDDVTDF